MATTTANGTAAWMNGQTAELGTVQRRPSVARLLGAAAGAVTVRGRGMLGDLFDVAGLGALTYGAFQLPGTWGEVGGWVAGGLCLLITGAKLNP